MGKTLFYYIFKEIITTIFATAFIFTMVFLLGKAIKMMDLVVNRGLSIIDLTYLITLNIPYLLIYIIPLSCLIAVMLTFINFSTNNELVIIENSGLSPVNIIKPVVWAGCLIMILSLYISNFARPAATTLFKKEIVRIASHQAIATLKPQQFNTSFPSLVIFIEEINGANFKHIMISDTRDIKNQNIILSKEGIFFSSKDKNTVFFQLKNGTIHALGDDGKDIRTIDFMIYNIKIDLLNITENLELSDNDMTTPQLIKAFYKKEISPDKKLNIKMELNKRFAMPFSSLILILIAFGIGMNTMRIGKIMVLFFGMLAFLSYYGLFTIGSTLVEYKIIPSFFGSWLPNLVLLPFCLILIIQVYRGKPLYLFILLTRWTEQMKEMAVKIINREKSKP